MALSRKATNIGRKAAINTGRASRNFALAAFGSKGRPPEVGDTVRRKTDGKEFHVVDVKPYGITLVGQSGLFNAAGFEVITHTKHR